MFTLCLIMSKVDFKFQTCLNLNFQIECILNVFLKS